MAINQHHRDILNRYVEDKFSAENVNELKNIIEYDKPSGKDWKQLKKAVAVPDESIKFPNKNRLYKPEVVAIETKNPVIRRMWSYAATVASIAAMFFLAIVFKNSGDENVIAKKNTATITQPINKKNEVAVVTTSKDPQTKNSNVAVAVITPKNTEIKKQINTSTDKILVKENPQIITQENKSENQNYRNNITGKKQIESAMALLKNRSNSYSAAYNNTTDAENYIRRHQQKKVAAPVKIATISEKKNTPDLNTDTDDRTFAETVRDLFTDHIKIQKQTENNESYYAYSLETKKIRVAGKVKPNF
ncbi:MAG: hypothetical protein NTX03_03105 [Bacteroidetes bacterium]|nr:hypothetical protein [Bacteroidota bacterium]